ncbi:MAG: efflux RND transporter periplasmic adaptor subunit [Acidobacteria bacterium]|nr:efflux RND transporter periplasmic adaptor subunit [Acidobacteriota bacterium]
MNREIIEEKREESTSESAPVTNGDESGAPLRETTVKSEYVRVERSRSLLSKRNLVTALIIALVAFVALALVLWRRNTAPATGKTATETREGQGAGRADEHGAEESAEVRLEPETLAFAGLEYEGVTQRPAIGLLRVTGAVEPNPHGVQQVTPLVGGRVEQVFVAVGDRVNAGQTVAVIASPQVAQMHGKLHEAETTLALAERNLQRVQRAENRVAVLQARAQLDEAEATLRRTRRLVELGAGAGKDLIAAETAYRTARADFDFQSNISLNRELQEARAAVETARVDVAHIRDEMRALGAPVPDGDDDHRRNTSLVPVRAPASGIVTERSINAGAGIDAGTLLFTISNLSTVYVIANVPETQAANVRVGTAAEIRSAAMGDSVINGRVSYIDPQLDEATRTAGARIEVANPGERLRAGMFVEVGFQTTTNDATGQELVVPERAVQREGSRTVVFILKDDEPGAFEVREIQAGGSSDGYTRVLSGLRLGERVVTRGSFTLKTQMQKGEMGEHGH